MTGEDVIQTAGSVKLFEGVVRSQIVTIDKYLWYRRISPGSLHHPPQVRCGELDAQEHTYWYLRKVNPLAAQQQAALPTPGTPRTGVELNSWHRPSLGNDLTERKPIAE